MIDMNLQRVLLETAQIGRDDVVLEVGTGTGGLTRADGSPGGRGGDRGGRSQSPPTGWRGTLPLPQRDPLAHRRVGDQEPASSRPCWKRSSGSWRRYRGRRWKLVANLPYNVATPLISNLLALDHPPCTMTITVQKEVADRIVARPGVKDYGGVGHLGSEPVPCGDRSRSGAVGLLAAAQGLLGLRANCPGRDAAAANSRAGLFSRVRATMFLHRRKILRSQLLSAQKRLDKARVDALLAELGLEPTLRAERLGPEEMLRLCEAVRLGMRQRQAV